MSFKRRRTFALVAIAIASVMEATVLYAQGVDKWQSAAPFPEPAEELYGVAANGKMYVIGGFGSGGSAMGIVYEYDSTNDKWTKKVDAGSRAPCGIGRTEWKNLCIWGFRSVSRSWP